MEYQLLKQRGALDPAYASGAAEEAAGSLLLADWKPRQRGGKDWSKIEIKSLQVSAKVLELLPASVAHENCVLPLAFDGETLTVACTSADDIALADKLRFILAKDVRLVQFKRADIEKAIARNYRVTAESADSLLQEFADSAVSYTMLAAGENIPISASHSSAHGKPAGGIVRARRSAAAAPQQSARGQSRAVDYNRDSLSSQQGHGIMFYTVDEGQRVLRTRLNGTKEVLIGPQRVWRGRNRFSQLSHWVAHPGEFLIVKLRDGTERHLPGPAEEWLDPRVHESIGVQDCLQIASKEAVVVYSRQGGGEADPVSRRIVYGPTLFTPAPGEWLHTFSWHASSGGHEGVQKVPNALKFQKLWLMPDQMYHDVRDVRTADNAVLVIKLMIFFELTDIDRMLDTTHDPVGDFVNAATADVVEFTGKHAFESFKQNTDRLNDLATYRTLHGRAQQIGYRINNVVYRGYGAADALQKMHDQAIEARTRLQLDRATEEQTQDLENFRLEAQLARAGKRREEQIGEVRHDLELTRQKQEAELQNREARQAFVRQQKEADARVREDIARRRNELQREHFSSLGELGVDLTAYLTQARADQVIELRGGGRSAPHVHLEPTLRASVDGNS